ncbi:MAG: DegT/DnrJ/EryC1/StrS family aminotransferase [bacterium]
MSDIPALAGGKPVRKGPLHFSPPLIGKEEIEEVVDTLKSGWITTGPKVKRFQEEFAEYVGARFAVALSSCTAGLHLALVVGGVSPGDEVITSPYTFAATANVILHCGAKPVFADIDEKTCNIDPNKIEEKITPKTKAIIPVHFGGQPCEMDVILDVAERHNLLVIEDAAHAITAKYKDKMIGSVGDMTVFSFHAVKNLTTAEGGMLTTDNEGWVRPLKLYSLHGQDKDAFAKFGGGEWKYEIVVPGYKYNMTDIQAAIGIWQLRKIEGFLKRRKQYVEMYNEGLDDLEALELPQEITPGRHAWHLYTIRLRPGTLRIDRDDFIEALRLENVSANVHFIPVHVHPYYRETFGYRPEDFPVSWEVYRRTVTLPLNVKMTEADVGDVIAAVRKIVRYYSR